MHVRVTLALIATALSMAVASPVVLAAGGSPGGQGGSTGISCSVLSSECQLSAGSPRSQGGSGSGGSSPVTCTWQPVSQPAWLLIGTAPTEVVYGQPTAQDETGQWYLVTCDDGDQFFALVYADAVTTPTVGQLSVSELGLRAPTVSMAPSGKAIVNLKSWLWIDPAQWQPIHATAAAGGITAIATAAPEYVVWDMGDGNQVTCAGPGIAYNTNIPDQDQSTTCGYTYQETSANAPNQQFTITATIEYDVSWASVGVAGGGDLGDVAGASTITPVTVDEIGTVTVPNP
jgi:hypothetical protein